MPAIARVGIDHGKGVCHCHPVPINVTVQFTTGASSVLINGHVCCIVTSKGVASCGHPTVATEGSPDTFAEGQPVHRIGDAGTIGPSGCGVYTVVTGSPDTFIN